MGITYHIKTKFFTFILCVLFILSLWVLADVPAVQYLLWWYIPWSLLTFMRFFVDKLRSENPHASHKRVPEIELIGLMVLGGVLGGYFGMLLCRHKTTKHSFWLSLNFAFIMHLIIVWFVA